MKRFNKLLCVILVFTLLFALVGCDSDNTDSTISSSAPSSSTDSTSNSSSSEPSSSNASSSAPSQNMGNNYEIKDPFFDSNGNNEDSNIQGGGQNNQGFTSDWPGPKGYVIVVPKNNQNAMASAEILQQYFLETSGVEPTIVDDSTSATDKEIIIGKTNRPESIKNLKDSQMQVALNGKKLVFAGGHDVTVDKAVRHFVKNASSHQNIYTFTQTTDFSANLNGYKYVWGDEFEDSKLNLNKWSTLHPKMGDGGVMIMGNTSDVISIKDGALCLTAYKDDQGKYHIPNSVHSEKTMNFLYGYVEIRAKIPLNVGCFASFWTRSVSDSGIIKGKFDNLFAEVDVFEILQKKGGQHLAGNILKIPTKDSAQYWCTADMTNAQAQPHLDNNYHLIAYEWTPDEMKFYYDGNLYARFDLTSDWVEGPVLGKGKPGWSVNFYANNKKRYSTYFDTSGTGMDCFREAQYLIFNHHLHHEDAFKASTSVTKNANFKSEDYLIDYVRVYQLDGQKLYTK